MKLICMMGLISILDAAMLRLCPGRVFPENKMVQNLCAGAAWGLLAVTGLYILLLTGSLVPVSLFLLGAELPVLAADAGREGL